MDITPTLLLILDGWGLAEPGPGNAVFLARTPNLDKVLETYPSTTLKCSGKAVGLPDGFMGNSEVGHLNIGAGRVVYQDFTRIDLAIENGSFFENQALLDLAGKLKKTGGRLHMMGLVSDGGVHSHMRHIKAALKFAEKQGFSRDQVFFHAYLDGRDTSPTSGKRFMAELVKTMDDVGVGHTATMTGRFYAMDRDKRWERVQKAYWAVVHGEGIFIDDPVAAIEQAYAGDETDEFMRPRVVKGPDGGPLGPIQDGDGVFFVNFRADRAREMTRTLFDPEFSEFDRGNPPDLAGLVTMTEYDAEFGLPAAFPPETYENILGEVVSNMGLKQLRLAETEKYAHVTYFFNGGVETPFPNEQRILIPSPRDVPTYDLKPEMSVYEVTDTLCREWDKGDYGLVVCNLANLDMVGHTGIIKAAVKACEAVDACVGKILDTVLPGGGRILLTADHGNAEQMLDSEGGPQTAHTTNPVPFVIIEKNGPGYELRGDGILGDIAPTLLNLWNVALPREMTGQTLVLKKG